MTTTKGHAMTAPLTDAELADARQLVEAATPGEWFAQDHGNGLEVFHAYRGHLYNCIASHTETHDAAFIAASRSLVPRLLAEVERLRASCCHDYVGEDCPHRSKP